MPLMDIQKRVRHLWRTYGTLNNIVMVVALAIAASWAWGTVTQMQTNFAAQKAVDEQTRTPADGAASGDTTLPAKLL